MASKSKKTTYDRILDKSIQLFNRYGVFNVSVQRIAAALKISPGNVTYHFKKKNDILHAILKRVEEKMAGARSVAEEIDADVKTHYDYMLNVHQDLWEYRFIFNNMIYLNSEDRKLGKRIIGVQTKARRVLVELLEFAIGRKWIKPIAPPNSPELLTDNLWFLWLSWLRMSQLEGKGKAALLTFATDHFYSLMQPHWDEKISAGILQYIKIELAK